MKIDLHIRTTGKPTLPKSGVQEYLPPTHKRFVYIANVETVDRVKQYARDNDMTIKDTMEMLVSKGFEAVQHAG